jgi:hypothetical protein
MKKTVIFTVVLTALVAASGCKGKKKAGDKCTGDEASCLDKTNILECHDGVLAQMTCKGAKGCSEKATGSTRSGKTVTTNFAVDCDFSGAAEGDACLDDSSQCSADNTTMVTCKAKKIALTKCLGPKACVTSPTVIDCDTSVQPAGAPCEGADDVACTPDKKQMLTCTGGKLVVGQNCRGPKGCTIEARKIGCDSGAQNVGDPCATAGDYECSADKKAILKCTGGKWASDTTCPKKKACGTTGNNVGCQ